MEERISREKRKPEEIVARLLNCKMHGVEIDYHHHNTRPLLRVPVSLDPEKAGLADEKTKAHGAASRHKI
jgi:hypothetical protein